MERVAIVGAGVAGAGAATVLDERADVDTTIFERSGAVGGRAATRVRGDVVYDHGANYLKSADDRIDRLVSETLDTAGLVDVADPVYVFDESGTVRPGRDADDHKWSYRAGLRDLTRRLLGRTDASVHLETRIDSCASADGWVLEAGDGTRWGPFDAVVLTPPGPVASGLLPERAGLGEVADDLTGVEYRAIYSAALHYPFEIERPYYALVNTDKRHDVGWVSREDCKPGHVPDGESLLVVQATHAWSVANADRSDGRNARELAATASSLVGDDRLVDPDWTDGRLWQHALPGSRVAPETVDRADRAGLFIAGDAVVGEGRIHAALRSGLEAGDRMLGAAQNQPASDCSDS